MKTLWLLSELVQINSEYMYADRGTHEEADIRRAGIHARIQEAENSLAELLSTLTVGEICDIHSRVARFASNNNMASMFLSKYVRKNLG